MARAANARLNSVRGSRLHGNGVNRSRPVFPNSCGNTGRFCFDREDVASPEFSATARSSRGKGHLDESFRQPDPASPGLDRAGRLWRASPRPVGDSAVRGEDGPLPEVRQLGSVVWPGTLVDKSGLTDLMEDGSPQNRLGGFGSGVAWTGHGDDYVLIPDRGPGTGPPVIAAVIIQSGFTRRPAQPPW